MIRVRPSLMGSPPGVGLSPPGGAVTPQGAPTPWNSASQRGSAAPGPFPPRSLSLGAVGPPGPPVLREEGPFQAGQGTRDTVGAAATWPLTHPGVPMGDPRAARGGPGRSLSPLLAPAWPPSLGSVLATLLELSTYGLLLYWTVHYFGLEVNWDKKLLDSKVGTSGGDGGEDPECPLPAGPEGPALTPGLSLGRSLHLPRVHDVAADGDAAAGGGGLPVPVLGDPRGHVPVRGGHRGVPRAVGTPG